MRHEPTNDHNGRTHNATNGGLNTCVSQMYAVHMYVMVLVYGTLMVSPLDSFSSPVDPFIDYDYTSNTDFVVYR